MRTTIVAATRRPVAIGLAVVCALMGGFLLGRAHAQGDGITFAGPSLLYQPIKADKTADYEAVLRRLRQGIKQLNDPQLNQQAAGWKIYRLNAPPANNTVNYVHVIEPAVPNANYALMPILYKAFTESTLQTEIYNQYRDAFGGPPSAVGLTLVADLSQ